MRANEKNNLVVAVLLALAAAGAARADEWPEPLDGPPRVEERAQWGRGPFEVRDAFVLGHLRASPYARSPRTLAPLTLELGARATWASSYGWLDDAACRERPVHRVSIDGETRDLDLVARLGLLPRLELGVEVGALRWRGGGDLDPLIEGFHEKTGMGDARRGERPRNAYRVDGTSGDGRWFSLDERGTGFGDTAVSLRGLVLEGSEHWPAVSLTLTGTLPTAESKLDYGRGFSGAVQLDASKRVLDGPLVLYLGAAYTYHGSSRAAGLDLFRHRFMGYLGLELELTPEVSFIAHGWIETAREKRLFSGTDLPFGNQIQYVAFGVKVEPVPGLVIEAGFLENFHDPNTSADVGAMMNVWYAFDLKAKP